MIDNGGNAGSSIPLNLLVETLASVHAAHDPKKGERTNHHVVRWRNGIYSIVPSILLNIKNSAHRFDLVCIDYFWANIKVREDGSIRTGFILPYIDMRSTLHHMGAKSSRLQRLKEPSVGTAILLAPDIPLYLSLSTPLHHGEPDLLLHCPDRWIYSRYSIDLERNTIFVFESCRAKRLPWS